MDLNVGVAEALGTDYFYIREQLTSAQLVYLARTREFVTAEVQPVINGYWERAESRGNPAQFIPHGRRRGADGAAVSHPILRMWDHLVKSHYVW